MFLGGLGGRAHWPIRMALRAAVTGMVEIAAGLAVTLKALPAIKEQTIGLDASGPPVAEWLLGMAYWLPVAGVPAVVLGVLAMVTRPVRPVLALLAMVVSVAALAAILGTLISSLLPLYVGHYDLDHLSQ